VIAALVLAAAISMPAKAKREMPVETLCVKDGFTYYNGMTTEFKRLSKDSYSFLDLTWTRKKRNLTGVTCYQYVNGNFDDLTRKK